MKKKFSGKFNALPVILIFIIVGLVFIGTIYLMIQHNRNSIAKTQAQYQEEIQELQDKISTSAEAIVVTKEVAVTADTIKEVIAPAGKLTSYEYYYTDVGEFTKEETSLKIIKHTDQTLYTYTGVIGVGVDLSDVDVAVNEDAKEITVIIPEPKILSHQFIDDSFEAYDVKNSKFVETNLSEFKEFETELKQRQEEKLNNNDEFWEGAKDNTKNVISNILNATGKLDEYNIDYKWVSNKK